LLTVVEVADSLSGLVGGVGVPDTTSLRGDLLNGVGVGRIGRRDVLDGASLNTNNTDRDTAKTSTADDDGPGPATECLLERATVEKTGQEALL